MKLSVRSSFRKSKKDVSAECEPSEEVVETTSRKEEKEPRKGLLGKMGMKKKSSSKIKAPQASNVGYSINGIPSGKPRPTEEQKPEPAGEKEPITEPDDAAPATTEDAEDATPMEEEPKVEEEDEPAVEERDEEEPKEEEAVTTELSNVSAEEPVPEEQSVSEEREQPETPPAMNTGLLCGCV